MRNVVTPVILASLAAVSLAAFGCAKSAPESGAGGSSPSGAGGGGGMSTSMGTGGGTVTCSNTDTSIIPIDSTGWVARQCDAAGIQGAFYCYTDGATQTNCTANTPPWNASMGGMCLSGTTLGVAADWGAGIGLSLNDSGGTPDVKGTYNATTNNVVGFTITVTGSWSGLDLRVGFHGSAAVAPFYTISGPGTYSIMFTQAQVPTTWTGTANAGMFADPTTLADLQFQMAGDSKALPFNFCVTSIKPITTGTSAGTGGGSGTGCGTLAPFAGGAVDTGNNDVIQNVGNYAVQNDVYNPSGGSETITATQGGACAGFTAKPSLNVAGNTPGSYPSIVYGWHYGKTYGPYNAPKQISAITSVPSSWDFTVPGSGVKYDVSYDIWINQGGGNPAQPDANTLELMIWLDETSDVVPAGTAGAAVTIAGTSWQIYTGTMNTWHYIAYKRAASGAGVSNLDLKAFMTDAATRNVGATTAWYLLSVEAGFEIWTGQNVSFTTNSYSVTVN